MGINSNTNESASAIFLAGVIIAAMLMIVILSVLAGMIMDVDIFDSYMIYVMWAGMAASITLLALFMKPSL